MTPAEGKSRMLLTREREIRERDPLTRFSYAWGPLTRYPGCSVASVKRAVCDELAALDDLRVPLVPHERRAVGDFSTAAARSGR